jgi:threonyl-tRNA synthetase
MKALLLHANSFETKLTSKATLPKGIEATPVSANYERMNDCLVVLCCIEEGDSIQQVAEMHQEAIKTAEDFSTRNIVVAPFVHLSNNVANPTASAKLFEEFFARFEGSQFNVTKSEFGYHKALKLDVKGYPGSFRFREFT